jgi:hypothetical protein
MEAEQQHIHLLYWREGNTETFSGVISGGKRELHFTASRFATMLEWVQSDLVAFPSYRLVMQRKEAPYPVTFPPGFEDIIRKDPKQAAEMLSPAPQRVVVSDEKTPPKKTSVLRVGHDTLADAIGELVYLRTKTSVDNVGLNRGVILVESPITGRWVATQHQLCHGLRFELVQDHNRWATMETQKLLDEDEPRYYLPRLWNPTVHTGSKGWIDHRQLEELYASYLKEKASV